MNNAAPAPEPTAETVRLPYWKHAYERLTMMGLLEHGKLLTWQLLESLLFAKRRESKMGFRLIELRRVLKRAHGIILSERGTNGAGLRLLNKEELCSYTQDKLRAGAREARDIALGLGQVDMSDQSEATRAKTDLAQRRAALVAITTASILRRRSLPPPGQTMKSIKQIE